jgi:choice-of-anchor B domain-containing protein
MIFVPLPYIIDEMRIFFLFIIGFSISGFAQDHKNVFLLDNWNTDTLLALSSGIVYNETWGFVQDGREYGVIGSTEGTHIFELTAENKLNPVAFVRGNYASPLVVHRDFHDYKGYLYAVCDEGNSSLQIIDLQYLPDSVHVVVNDSINFGRVHNIFIDSSSALLYACTFTPVVGNPSSSFTSINVFSLADPLNPVKVFDGFEEIAEVHDAYVVNDTAFLNCGFDGLRIYDFSTPQQPQLLGTLSIYQDQGYNHSGWLSPDRKFYYFIDETNGKQIKKIAISNISNPTLVGLFGTNFLEESVAHNIMATDNLLFVSYYNEGLRIFDTRYKPPREVAHYDTYPDDDPYKMHGAWGVYSLLPSGRILVSDRKYGLFLFHFDHEIFTIPPSPNVFTAFPNPAQANEEVIFRFNERNIKQVRFYLVNKLGQQIYSETFDHQDYWTLRLNLAQGTYNYSVYYENHLGDVSLKQGQILVVE